MMGLPEGEVGRSYDETQHPVTLSAGFWMGKVEVTQKLWTATMGSNPSVEEYKGVALLGENYPVQGVSWCDAVAFANVLSAKEGLKAAYSVPAGFGVGMSLEACNAAAKDVKQLAGANGYQLPTEAQWEWAARGGTTQIYAGTSEAKEVCRYANVADVTAEATFSWDRGFDCTDGYAGFAAVGSKLANGYGLYDMTGNVWEWVWDRYGSYATSGKKAGADSIRDPQGNKGGEYRVYRGGSWAYDPEYTRVANRYWHDPGYRLFDLGFRLIRSSLDP
jgi:formylglycine-generating enzyme required for sulfatase activity